jgi:beta-glucosidase
MSPLAVHSNGGAGYVPGIPRLGIPGDSDVGRGLRRAKQRREWPLLDRAARGRGGRGELGSRCSLRIRSTDWPRVARAGLQHDAGRRHNLTREPRNGRTFEYLGEDPVLAGKMVGSVMKGLQAQHVIGDIKHYALNDQESGRNAVNVNIDKRAARESDLLAFEIGLQESDAAAVMCSYNRVWGDYACENKYLLTDS